MKIFLVLMMLVSGFEVMALEVDEKLTARVVGTSESKKTILINRGIEDGLAVGDHAKFFISTGVISRGVVIKTSPSRSVWSLYRLVDNSFIREEQVLNLKITPPVKITKDESKMLVNDDSSVTVVKDPRDLGIPLAEGADDLSRSEVTNKPMNVQEEWNEGLVSLLEKNRELFGMLNYSSYNEKTSPDDSSGDYTKDVSTLYLKAGGEWYFKTEEPWYSRVSFLVHFAIDRKSIMAHQGALLSERGSEFGLGFSIHPYRRPSSIHRLISYLNYTLALGSTNSNYEPGQECSVNCERTVDGSVFAHSFGFGYKYYTSQGIGARLEMSYLIRGDSYGKDVSNVTWVKTRLGPRLLFGLSYRI